MTKGKTSERYLEILGKIIKPNSMCLGVYEEFTAEYDFLDDSNLNGIRRSKLELYLARIDGVPHHGFWSRFVFPCSSYVCLEVERI